MTTTPDVVAKLATLSQHVGNIKTAITNRGAAAQGVGLAALASRITGVTPPALDTTPDAWTRSADWRALPTPALAEEAIYILCAVKTKRTYVALICQGDYTVDWGDGVVDNVAGGSQAEHLYDYNNPALTGTDCARGYRQAIIKVTPQAGQHLTFVDLAPKHSIHQLVQPTDRPTFYLDVVMRTPQLKVFSIYGLHLYNPTTTTNINQGQQLLERVRILAHSLIDASHMFRNCPVLRVVELTGGFAVPAVRLVGTAVTPAVANVFTLPNHGLSVGDPIQLWSGTNFATLTQAFVSAISGNDVTISTSATSQTGSFTAAANVMVGVSAQYMFADCLALQVAPALTTTSVSDARSMFNGCKALRVVPLYDLSQVVAAPAMFSACKALTALPDFNLDKARVLSYFMAQTTAMTITPALRTAAVVDMQFFAQDSGITTVYLPSPTGPQCDMTRAFDSASVTRVAALRVENMKTPAVLFGITARPGDLTWDAINAGGAALNLDSLFAYRPSLRQPPLFANTQNVTSVSNLFKGCTKLTKAGDLAFPAATSAASMFEGCTSLQEVGTLAVMQASDVNRLFYSCAGLTKVTGLTAPQATDWTMLFANCAALVNPPAIEAPAALTLPWLFSNCSALTICPRINAPLATNISQFAHSTMKQFPDLTFGPNTPWSELSNVSIQRLVLKGVNKSITFYSMNMTVAALEEFYNNLAAASAGAVLQMPSSNANVQASNRAIASNKGWTVTLA